MLCTGAANYTHQVSQHFAWSLRTELFWQCMRFFPTHSLQISVWGCSVLLGTVKWLHSEELHEFYCSLYVMCGWKIEEDGWDGMGRVCGCHGEKIYAYIILIWQSERYHLEDLGIYWRIILKWVIIKYWESVDWVNVTEDMGQWCAVVNKVMNLLVTWNDSQNWRTKGLIQLMMTGHGLFKGTSSKMCIIDSGSTD